MLAAGVTGLVAYDHTIVFRILSIIIDILILYFLMATLMLYSLPRRIKFSDVRLGASVAAVGLVVLQYAGGYLLARQLQHLDALYSYFALSLGLLFWIYLQAQVIFYALEIASVHSLKLWPRSFNGKLINK